MTLTKQHIRYGLTACIAGMLSFASCDKIKEAIKVDLGVSSSNIEFTIPVLEQEGVATLGASEVYLNIDSIIKAQDSRVSAANIRSVKITDCTITMIDGDSMNNFSALEACKIQLSSNMQPDLISIAELSGNPDVESHTLTIPVNSDVELAGYFNATRFTYTITGTARKTTSRPLACKATISYNIVAGL